MGKGLAEDATNTCVRWRTVVSLLAFLGFFNMYALRVNLSVAIDQMITDIPELTDGTPGKGFILSAFYIGYVPLQMPGGMIAERFGGAPVFGIGVLVTALLTMATPFAAHAGYWYLIAIRIIEGLFEAATFPAHNALWAKWAPPDERTTLTTRSQSGTHLGTVFSLFITGLCCDRKNGWPTAFYSFGLAGIVWFFAWLALIRSSPEQHSCVSVAERQYIEEAIAEQRPVKAEWNRRRLIAMVTSGPLWAIVVGHCCQNWGYYTLLSELPSFFKDVLGFDYKKIGFASALPYLASFVMTAVGGIMADAMRSKGFRTSITRKVFQTTGLLGCAVLLVVCGYTALSSPHWVLIALLTLGLGVDGLVFSGYNCNHLDIAPPFAGTLYGFTNSWANCMGIIAPIVTDAMVGDAKGEAGADLWQNVFWLNLGIAVFGCLWFCAFAKGEPEAWATQQSTLFSDEEQSRDPSATNIA